MATRPKAVIESRNGEKLSPITITKNVLTDDGQNLHDILSDRKEDMMTPTIENSSSMFKVGQGDNVDYSSNVVNGAYESMVLKGKTMVNIHKSAIYSLSRKNEGWYENLVAETNRISFEVTDTSTDGWKYLNLGKLNLDMLKSNTKYLVYFGVANFPHNLGVRFMNGNATDKISNEAMVAQGSNWAILTTSSEIIKSEQVLYVTFTNVLGKVEVGNVMIFEYQEGMENLDIPYFEGICDVKSPILSNVGKNLLPTELSRSFKHITGNQVVSSIDLTSFLNRGVQYVIKLAIPKNVKIAKHYSSNSADTESVLVSHGAINSNNTIARFTIPSNSSSYYLFVNESGQSPSDYISDISELVTIELDTGNNPTEITPYKSNTTTFKQKDGKMIVLRSLPNGVCDTLNVETGEYVQRIGELVANGDDTITYNGISTTANNTVRMVINHPSIQNNPNEMVVCAYCDRAKYKYNYQDTADIEGFFVAKSNNRIFMRLEKSKLETLNVAGIKKYLSKTPYTFQYELKEPIVSTIDIQGFPYAYTNGHVQLSSGHNGQSLTPKVEYSVVTNRSGQIRSNQKMVERHQKQLDRLQAMVLTNLVNTQYEQTLTNLKYDLKNVREEVK